MSDKDNLKEIGTEGLAKMAANLPLRKVWIKRTETGDEGTFGTLKTDGAFEGHCAELPWRGNAKEKSCIPSGVYKCVLTEKPKHGVCYEVLGVPKRDAILFHSANWAGDESKGYKAQLLGCIAPGRSIGTIVGQKAVTSSKDALAGFMADLDGDNFTLTITWDEKINPEVKENK